MGKKTDILQKIAETGDCEFILPGSLDGYPCTDCPLSKLKKRPDGSGWLSCFEAVCGPDFYDGNTKSKYKKAAESKLLELAIEDALGNDAEKKVDT